MENKTKEEVIAELNKYLHDISCMKDVLEGKPCDFDFSEYEGAFGLKLMHIARIAERVMSYHITCAKPKDEKIEYWAQRALHDEMIHMELKLGFEGDFLWDAFNTFCADMMDDMWESARFYARNDVTDFDGIPETNPFDRCTDILRPHVYFDVPEHRDDIKLNLMELIERRSQSERLNDDLERRRSQSERLNDDIVRRRNKK